MYVLMEEVIKQAQVFRMSNGVIPFYRAYLVMIGMSAGMAFRSLSPSCDAWGLWAISRLHLVASRAQTSANL